MKGPVSGLMSTRTQVNQNISTVFKFFLFLQLPSLPACGFWGRIVRRHGMGMRCRDIMQPLNSNNLLASDYSPIFEASQPILCHSSSPGLGLCRWACRLYLVCFEDAAGRHLSPFHILSSASLPRKTRLSLLCSFNVVECSILRVFLVSSSSQHSAAVMQSD